MGMTDSYWDPGQYAVGKLAVSTLWGSVDQCLVGQRGLACALFGTGEPVCVRGWASPCVTEFSDKHAAGLNIPVRLCLMSVCG